MDRNSIGIELLPEYYEMVKEQIEPLKLVLFEPEVDYEPIEINERNSIR